MEKFHEADDIFVLTFPTDADVGATIPGNIVAEGDVIRLTAPMHWLDRRVRVIGIDRQRNDEGIFDHITGKFVA